MFYHVAFHRHLTNGYDLLLISILKGASRIRVSRVADLLFTLILLYQKSRIFLHDLNRDQFHIRNQSMLSDVCF